MVTFSNFRYKYLSLQNFKPDSKICYQVNQGPGWVTAVNIFWHRHLSRSSWDFRPPFFHDSNQSRPLINRLKYFRIRLQVCRDNQILKSYGVCISLRSLTPCMVCIISQSQALQWAPHLGSKWTKVLKKLCSVHLKAESSSVVCIPPRSLTPRCDASRGRANYLPSVCFDLKFYKCYFSVKPEDVNMKISYCRSRIV